MSQLWVHLPCVLLLCGRTTQESSRQRRSVMWPRDSGMGLFLAVAFPVDLPNYELSLSYNFEANYLLPDNLTELQYPPTLLPDVRLARDLTRGRVYSLLEDRIEKEGLEGKACLLRMICETAANPVHGHNGVLGDLLHLIFTPSSTAPEALPPEYPRAESLGLAGHSSCLSEYPDCPADPYDFFTVWAENSLLA